MNTFDKSIGGHPECGLQQRGGSVINVGCDLMISLASGLVKFSGFPSEDTIKISLDRRMLDWISGY